MAFTYMPWIYPTDRYYYGWYDDAVDIRQMTDADIKSVVVDRLRENPWTRDDDIRVDVKRNVVILTGDISSARAKRAAGDDTWDTKGVVDVSNQLRLPNDA